MKRSGHKNSRATKPSLLNTIAACLVAVMLIAMAILFGVSFKSVPEDSPILVIDGADSNIRGSLLRYGIHASGFEYTFVNLQEDGALEDYAEDRIVILTTSETGLEVIKKYEGNSNVYGFILVCPKYPGNASMDFINSSEPACDIAIFTGRDTVKNISDVDGARLIFERISGVDTVYGTPIRRGGFLGSDCFIGNLQNRYLSISDISYADGNGMLKSPLFISELASYLTVTYSGLIASSDTSVISIWSSLTVLVMFMFVVAFCFYLITLPKERRASDVELNKKINANKMYLSTAIISSVIGIVSVVIAMIPALKQYSGYVVTMLPVLTMVFILVTSIKYIGKIETKISGKILLRGAFMAASEIIYVILAGLLLANLRINIKYIVPIIIVVSLIDAISAGLLDYAKKAGSFTIYENYKIAGILLIPGVLSLLAGLILGNMALSGYGFASVLLSLLPLIFVTPIRNHADHPAIVGLVHGSIYLIILLAIF